uniref:Sec7 domain-containing protein n=1 Tax=Toxoplasma gondii COUG TaxID=1074873 RepID=A0A2G8Y450_TOXGO|nr:Sec7 domain-containing protein [Toxoplasma gondii COUG]
MQFDSGVSRHEGQGGTKVAKRSPRRRSGFRRELISAKLTTRNFVAVDSAERASEGRDGFQGERESAQAASAHEASPTAASEGSKRRSLYAKMYDRHVQRRLMKRKHSLAMQHRPIEGDKLNRCRDSHAKEDRTEATPSRIAEETGGSNGQAHVDSGHGSATRNAGNAGGSSGTVEEVSGARSGELRHRREGDSRGDGVGASAPGVAEGVVLDIQSSADPWLRDAVADPSRSGSFGGTVVRWDLESDEPSNPDRESSTSQNLSTPVCPEGSAGPEAGGGEAANFSPSLSRMGDGVHAPSLSRSTRSRPEDSSQHVQAPSSAIQPEKCLGDLSNLATPASSESFEDLTNAAGMCDGGLRLAFTREQSLFLDQVTSPEGGVLRDAPEDAAVVGVFCERASSTSSASSLMWSSFSETDSEASSCGRTVGSRWRTDGNKRDSRRLAHAGTKAGELSDVAVRRRSRRGLSQRRARSRGEGSYCQRQVEALRQYIYMREIVEHGTLLFNGSPMAGIRFLQQQKILDDDSFAVAAFLLATDGLDKRRIGDLLGGPEPASTSVLNAFCSFMNFAGMPVDEALRHFLTFFFMPGESQIILRILERFAAAYVRDNPTAPLSLEQVHIVAYALLILNTSLHHPSLKTKDKKVLLRADFLKMVTGAGIALPENELGDMYARILLKEFKTSFSASEKTYKRLLATQIDLAHAFASSSLRHPPDSVEPSRPFRASRSFASAARDAFNSRDPSPSGCPSQPSGDFGTQDQRAGRNTVRSQTAWQSSERKLSDPGERCQGLSPARVWPTAPQNLLKDGRGFGNLHRAFPRCAQLTGGMLNAVVVSPWPVAQCAQCGRPAGLRAVRDSGSLRRMTAPPSGFSVRGSESIGCRSKRHVPGFREDARDITTHQESFRHVVHGGAARACRGAHAGDGPAQVIDYGSGLDSAWPRDNPCHEVWGRLDASLDQGGSRGPACGPGEPWVPTSSSRNSLTGGERREDLEQLSDGRARRSAPTTPLRTSGCRSLENNVTCVDVPSVAASVPVDRATYPLHSAGTCLGSLRRPGDPAAAHPRVCKADISGRLSEFCMASHDGAALQGPGSQCGTLGSLGLPSRDSATLLRPALNSRLMYTSSLDPPPFSLFPAPPECVLTPPVPPLALIVGGWAVKVRGINTADGKVKAVAYLRVHKRQFWVEDANLCWSRRPRTPLAVSQASSGVPLGVAAPDAKQGWKRTGSALRNRMRSGASLESPSAPAPHILVGGGGNKNEEGDEREQETSIRRPRGGGCSEDLAAGGLLVTGTDLAGRNATLRARAGAEPTGQGHSDVACRDGGDAASGNPERGAGGSGRQGVGVEPKTTDLCQDDSPVLPHNGSPAGPDGFPTPVDREAGQREVKSQVEENSACSGSTEGKPRDKRGYHETGGSLLAVARFAGRGGRLLLGAKGLRVPRINLHNPFKRQPRCNSSAFDLGHRKFTDYDGSSVRTANVVSGNKGNGAFPESGRGEMSRIECPARESQELPADAAPLKSPTPRDRATRRPKEGSAAHNTGTSQPACSVGEGEPSFAETGSSAIVGTANEVGDVRLSLQAEVEPLSPILSLSQYLRSVHLTAGVGTAERAANSRPPLSVSRRNPSSSSHANDDRVERDTTFFSGAPRRWRRSWSCPDSNTTTRATHTGASLPELLLREGLPTPFLAPAPATFHLNDPISLCKSLSFALALERGASGVRAAPLPRWDASTSGYLSDSLLESAGVSKADWRPRGAGEIASFQYEGLLGRCLRGGAQRSLSGGALVRRDPIDDGAGRVARPMDGDDLQARVYVSVPHLAMPDVILKDWTGMMERANDKARQGQSAEPEDAGADDSHSWDLPNLPLYAVSAAAESSDNRKGDPKVNELHGGGNQGARATAGRPAWGTSNAGGAGQAKGPVPRDFSVDIRMSRGRSSQHSSQGLRVNKGPGGVFWRRLPSFRGSPEGGVEQSGWLAKLDLVRPIVEKKHGGARGFFARLFHPVLAMASVNRCPLSELTDAHLGAPPEIASALEKATIPFGDLFADPGARQQVFPDLSPPPFLFPSSYPPLMFDGKTSGPAPQWPWGPGKGSAMVCMTLAFKRRLLVLVLPYHNALVSLASARKSAESYAAGTTDALSMVATRAAYGFDSSSSFAASVLLPAFSEGVSRRESVSFCRKSGASTGSGERATSVPLTSSPRAVTADGGPSSVTRERAKSGTLPAASLTCYQSRDFTSGGTGLQPSAAFVSRLDGDSNRRESVDLSEQPCPESASTEMRVSSNEYSLGSGPCPDRPCSGSQVRKTLSDNQMKCRESEASREREAGHGNGQGGARDLTTTVVGCEGGRDRSVVSVRTRPSERQLLASYEAPYSSFSKSTGDVIQDAPRGKGCHGPAVTRALSQLPPLSSGIPSTDLPPAHDVPTNELSADLQGNSKKVCETSGKDRAAMTQSRLSLPTLRGCFAGFHARPQAEEPRQSLGVQAEEAHRGRVFSAEGFGAGCPLPSNLESTCADGVRESREGLYEIDRGAEREPGVAVDVEPWSAGDSHARAGDRGGAGGTDSAAAAFLDWKVLFSFLREQVAFNKAAHALKAQQEAHRQWELRKGLEDSKEAELTEHVLPHLIRHWDVTFPLTVVASRRAAALAETIRFLRGMQRMETRWWRRQKDRRSCGSSSELDPGMKVVNSGFLPDEAGLCGYRRASTKQNPSSPSRYFALSAATLPWDPRLRNCESATSSWKRSGGSSLIEGRQGRSSIRQDSVGFSVGEGPSHKGECSRGCRSEEAGKRGDEAAADPGVTPEEERAKADVWEASREDRASAEKSQGSGADSSGWTRGCNAIARFAAQGSRSQLAWGSNPAAFRGREEGGERGDGAKVRNLAQPGGASEQEGGLDDDAKRRDTQTDPMYHLVRTDELEELRVSEQLLRLWQSGLPSSLRSFFWSLALLGHSRPGESLHERRRPFADNIAVPCRGSLQESEPSSREADGMRQRMNVSVSDPTDASRIGRLDKGSGSAERLGPLGDLATLRGMPQVTTLAFAYTDAEEERWTQVYRGLRARADALKQYPSERRRTCADFPFYLQGSHNFDSFSSPRGKGRESRDSRGSHGNETALRGRARGEQVTGSPAFERAEASRRPATVSPVDRENRLAGISAEAEILKILPVTSNSGSRSLSAPSLPSGSRFASPRSPRASDAPVVRPKGHRELGPDAGDTPKAVAQTGKASRRLDAFVDGGARVRGKHSYLELFESSYAAEAERLGSDIDLGVCRSSSVSAPAPDTPVRPGEAPVPTREGGSQTWQSGEGCGCTEESVFASHGGMLSISDVDIKSGQCVTESTAGSTATRVGKRSASWDHNHQEKDTGDGAAAGQLDAQLAPCHVRPVTSPREARRGQQSACQRHGDSVYVCEGGARGSQRIKDSVTRQQAPADSLKLAFAPFEDGNAGRRYSCSRCVDACSCQQSSAADAALAHFRRLERDIAGTYPLLQMLPEGIATAEPLLSAGSAFELLASLDHPNGACACGFRVWGGNPSYEMPTCSVSCSSNDTLQAGVCDARRRGEGGQWKQSSDGLHPSDGFAFPFGQPGQAPLCAACCRCRRCSPLDSREGDAERQTAWETGGEVGARRLIEPTTMDKSEQPDEDVKASACTISEQPECHSNRSGDCSVARHDSEAATEANVADTTRNLLLASFRVGDPFDDFNETSSRGYPHSHENELQFAAPSALSTEDWQVQPTTATSDCVPSREAITACDRDILLAKQGREGPHSESDFFRGSFSPDTSALEQRRDLDGASSCLSGKTSSGRKSSHRRMYCVCPRCSIGAGIADVVECVVLHMPTVGYVQGMAGIAGVLLFFMERERAFTIMVQLLQLHPLPDFFMLSSLGKRTLRHHLSAFKRYLAALLPELSEHFTSLHLSPSFYLLPWVLSLFTSILPLHIVVRVWDGLLLADGGRDTLFQIALAILHYYDEALRRRSFEGCVVLLSRQDCPSGSKTSAFDECRFFAGLRWVEAQWPESEEALVVP